MNCNRGSSKLRSMLRALCMILISVSAASSQESVTASSAAASSVVASSSVVVSSAAASSSVVASSAAASSSVVASSAAASTATTAVASSAGASSATSVASSSGASSATLVASSSGASSATPVASSSGASSATTVASSSGASSATPVASSSGASSATTAASSAETSSTASSALPTSPTTRPGATTRPPCSSTTCNRPPLDRFINSTELNTYLDTVSNAANGKVNLITLANGVKILKAKPYARRNVLNARHWPTRPVFFIETGFEANNFIAVSVALNFIDYLVNSCTKYCLYDYYVLPLINEEGYTYAKTTNSSWVKTREDVGSGCNGVNLLENFEHGDWPAGDTNACSDMYKGASVMSSPSTAYQAAKSAISNIKFTVTLTKNGNKLSHAPAHVPNTLNANAAAYAKYLLKYKIAAASSPSAAAYDIGSYADIHGVNRGHPLDFNEHVYANSFNVALDGDESNIVSKTEEFIAGLHAMIEHASNEQQGFE